MLRSTLPSASKSFSPKTLTTLLLTVRNKCPRKSQTSYLSESPPGTSNYRSKWEPRPTAARDEDGESGRPEGFPSGLSGQDDAEVLRPQVGLDDVGITKATTRAKLVCDNRRPLNQR